MTTQSRIYAAVIARGYGNRSDGEKWTPEELAVRQVWKAIDELRELYEIVDDTFVPGTLELLRHLRHASTEASTLFQSKDAATDCGLAIVNTAFAAELADVAIPLFVAAQALGIDLEAAMLAKAEADVKRGVRA